MRAMVLPVAEVAIHAADGRKLALKDLRWIVIEQDDEMERFAGQASERAIAS